MLCMVFLCCFLRGSVRNFEGGRTTGLLSIMWFASLSKDHQVGKEEHEM